jgi:hypothetical protein
VSFRIGRELGEIRVLVEVIDAHRGEDGDDDVVMGEVCVEGTAEREVLRIVGEGAVDAAVARSDVLVVEAGEEFL